MGGDVSVVGDVPVGEAREIAIPHKADPPVRASELPDHAHRDFVQDRVASQNLRAGMT